MPDQGRNAFEFGAFRFDPAERVLYRGPERVPLSPKVADTLLVLLTHRGRVVDKNQLIQMVWPDTFVEEGGLTRNISALRKALGDDPDGSGYIETVPKRGYRFVATAQELPPETQKPAVPEATGPAAPAAGRGRKLAVAVGGLILMAALIGGVAFWTDFRGPTLKAIAVLPLKNISNDPAEDYFSEGMTEVIATELSKTGLLVISPASARRLPAGTPLEEIGRRLKVEAVIQGTVLQSGGQVRINAQLVDIRTGRLLWADNYRREVRDVLSLQAEVAAAIARETTAKVATKRTQFPVRAVVPEAYQAYLKGRFFWNKRTEAGLRRAVEYFNEAIEKDGTYAPAHAGLADSWALLASNFYDAVRPREAMPRAKAAALHALQLDDRLAEAHTSLAYILMAYDWDLAGAEKEFQQAIRWNAGYATAHHWYAHCLLAAGRFDQAAAEMRTAQTLDPLSLPVNVGVGWASYFARRYDEAIRQFRTTLELEPGFAMAHQTLGMALAQKGEYRPAIAEFQKAVTLSGSSPSTIASLGYAYALAGAPADARSQLARLAELGRERYVPAIYMALVCLGLKDKAGFASWFSQAQEERSEYLIYYQTDPNFDAARTNFKLEFRPLPQ